MNHPKKSSFSLTFQTEEEISANGSSEAKILLKEAQREPRNMGHLKKPSFSLTFQTKEEIFANGSPEAKILLKEAGVRDIANV